MIKVTLTATAIAAAVSLGTNAIAGGHGNYFAEKQLLFRYPLDRVAPITSIVSSSKEI